MSEGMRRAGYNKGELTAPNPRRGLKSKKVVNALTEILKQKELVKAEQAKYKTDGRAYLQDKFIEHAHSPAITPNQTHALELVGKLDGHFVDRLEIDIGERTRQAAASRFIDTVLLPQPSQDK